jgi:low temperature requirement protein LtrA
VASRALVSPDDQRVTFVELFFDLVFVFAVTQVVRIYHHHPGWAGAGQALLVFWLVWWSWTQFTWALNAADTTHHLVELATLTATAVAFFMAVAVPAAFADRALWFAVPYVTGRVFGLVLYGEVAYAADPGQHRAVRVFTVMSVFGLAAVLAGAIQGGGWQYGWWSAAIVLDVIAAQVGASREGWNLHAEHFAERHGLFVIIALGESLIVAATGVSDAAWSPSRLVVAVLSVALTGGLWWTYFPRAKPRLDAALHNAAGRARSMLGRDVFSLIHFPLVCGIVLCAATIEEALAHPGDPLGRVWRVTLGAGLLLYLGSMVAATLRATSIWLAARAVLSVLTAVVVALVPGPVTATLSLALGGIVAIAVVEHSLRPRQPSPEGLPVHQRAT